MGLADAGERHGLLTLRVHLPPLLFCPDPTPMTPHAPPPLACPQVETAVVVNVLATLGQLARVSAATFKPHVAEVLPLVIEAITGA